MNAVENLLLAVVIYEPTLEQLKNIQKLRNLEIDFVVFQNSLFPKSDIPVLGNGVNVGVAAAYNNIFEYAKKRGKEFVLLLDQDTSYINTQNFHQIILELLSEFNLNKRLGAVGMKFNQNQTNDQFTPYILTSGTMYCVKYINSIGGFEEKLFIDEVEILAHMKLMINGYSVLSKFDYCMGHTVGDPIHLKIGKYKLNTTNHSPIRRYYMTRNRLHTKWSMRRHLIDVRPPIKSLIFEAIRVLLLERQKLLKLYYMYAGIRDFIKSKYGQY
jgi:rhamnosyltransferase